MQVEPGGRRGISQQGANRIALALTEMWGDDSQVEVARRLSEAGFPATQSRVSKWARAIWLPTPEQLNEIERTYGRPPGWTLVRAGFVDPKQRTEAASGLDDEALALTLAGTVTELRDVLAAVVEQVDSLASRLDALETPPPRSTHARR